MPTYSIEQKDEGRYTITNWKTVKDRNGKDVEVVENKRIVTKLQLETEIANYEAEIAERTEKIAAIDAL